MSRVAQKTIHQFMAERIQLATTYAEDGAFDSASRVLLDLGDELRAHAKHIDRALTALAEPGGTA